MYKETCGVQMEHQKDTKPDSRTDPLYSKRTKHSPSNCTDVQNRIRPGLNKVLPEYHRHPIMTFELRDFLKSFDNTIKCRLWGIHSLPNFPLRNIILKLLHYICREFFTDCWTFAILIFGRSSFSKMLFLYQVLLLTCCQLTQYVAKCSSNILLLQAFVVLVKSCC